MKHLGKRRLRKFWDIFVSTVPVSEKRFCTKILWIHQVSIVVVPCVNTCLPVVHDDSGQVCCNQRVNSAAGPWQEYTGYKNAGPQGPRQNTGQVDEHDSPPT